MPSHKKKPSSAALIKRKTIKKDEKKFNPFEVRVNKKKHEVIGQKSKSDKGLPGVARSKAVRKRKKTLLVEYKQRNKANQFIDRRFGEYNDELSVEEKMMQRFTLERKRKHERSSSFNLNLDNEEELTHFGQSIGDMEKFDHIVLSDNDDLGEDDIGDTHFGGFLTKKRPRLRDQDVGEEVSKPRTRKEVMEEVIAKSKAMKFKQQKEKHDVEDLLEKVNSEWKTLQSSLPKAGENIDGRHTPGDAYDRMVRELAFERRGNPTDRLKTEEEVANEEKERLVNLESHRVRRMKGQSEDAQDDTVLESADYIRDKPTRKKTVRFSLEYKDGELVLPADEDGDEEELGIPYDDARLEGVGAGSDEESVAESDSSGSGDPGVTYNSDLDSECSEEKSNDELDDERSKVNKPVSKVMKEAASRELPYTFTVPKSLLELQAIMTNRSPEECLTAVERIHACNHPSINPANKQKLVAFLPVLIDYCVSLNLSGHNLTVLNKLSRPLFKLSHFNSLHTAGVFRRLLQQTRDKWQTNSPWNKYPPFSELLLFKLIGLVFPTSDYKHPVTTPTLILMGQLLLKCHVKGVDDLVKGLFVCQTAVEFLSQSKRFIPEAVSFLTSAVGCFVKGKEGIVIPPFSSKTKSQLSTLTDNNQPTDECEDPTSLVQLLVDGKEVGDETPPTAVGGILKHTLLTLSQLVHLYSHLPSFSELFAPVSTNLKHVLKREWPPSLQQSLRKVSEEISSSGDKSKGVLQLLKQKPKSIKFYEPKFDEVYEVNRKKARTKAIGEKQKLKHKVTKETKGAVREIRRDTAFLAKERLTETLQLDAERDAKTKRILHDLQMGQHEAKKERRKRRK